jgi:hypothetical protein
MMRCAYLLPFLFGMTSALSFAQSSQVTLPITPFAPPQNSATPAAIPAVISADYSAEPVVIEHLDGVYSMAADGTGWRLQTLVARVQSDASVRQLGVLNFAFASGTSHVEINYVRVRHRDGTVTQTPIDSVIEMPSPATQAAPFYSDQKQMQIPSAIFRSATVSNGRSSSSRPRRRQRTSSGARKTLKPTPSL